MSYLGMYHLLKWNSENCVLNWPRYYHIYPSLGELNFLLGWSCVLSKPLGYCCKHKPSGVLCVLIRQLLKFWNC